MARFDECLSFILDREGRSDHETAGDPDTSWGVTQPLYDRLRQERGQPLQDVDLGTEAEFRAVYEKYFWRPLRCHELPEPLDLLVFDVGVNSGGGAATRLLQEALTAGLIVDGIMGGKTVVAAKMADPLVVAARFLRGRISQYTAIALTNPGKYKNLRGWLHRVGHLLLAL